MIAHSTAFVLMENVCVTRTFQEWIVHKEDVQMIVQKMEFVTHLPTNVSVNKDSLEKTVLKSHALKTAEENIKDSAITENASVLMDLQVLLATSKPVLILVQIMENALKGNANVS
jgi:hypothetical protein